MTSNVLISTLAFFAAFSAEGITRVLKPTMITRWSFGQVEASSTSESVMGPGAASTHRRLTYLESFTDPNMCLTAAMLPWASVFRIRAIRITSLEPAAATPAKPTVVLFPSSRWRFSATSRASCTVAKTSNWSPASGGFSKPLTCTAVEGGTSRSALPASFCIERTLQSLEPATAASPRRSVPRCTSTVARLPRCGSKVDSRTTPPARQS
mmetsp:Transcript_80262/g.227252  ORF Transcript_80262/g.227252 Transcript_80262/m.227252 type:complete len:210 (-) Transcript_80262:845-1474(-)